MDRELILKLIEAVSASPVSEFEYTSAGEHILIKKELRVPSQAAAHPAEAPQVKVQPVQSVEVNIAPEPSESTQDEGKIVKAPLVGVFYSSPAPDSPVFVELGQKVKRGDVLCIIEAMKVMNEIESEYDGVVLEIKAKNGELVEFGQPIIVIG